MIKTLKRLSLIALLGLTGLGSPFSSLAQSLSGTTGLVTVPTARMQDDGNLSLGVSYFDKKYQDYSNRNYDFASAYANFTFLPFLEMAIRINTMKDPATHKLIGVDRVPMFRLRLLKEKKYLPALVVGVHDFASTNNDGTVYFNATYLVLSKKIRAFDFHLGYSPKIMEAHDYQMIGLFGGVTYSPLRSLDLFAEYDSRYINTGIQYLFLKHFSIHLASLNFDSYALGAGCHFSLK